jgi:sigma-E factor negative regulatory protein RseA
MKDQLSALIDGELEIASSAHIITSVKSGGEMQLAWSEYHLIGDVMRGENSIDLAMSNRIMQAIAAEPVMIAPNSVVTKVSAITPVYKSSKFWSVAASVAAVMFVGVMVIQLQLDNSNSAATVEIAQSIPTEYLAAHQAAAPSGAAYYIQNASYSD